MGEVKAPLRLYSKSALFETLRSRISRDGVRVIAIDGRCGCGKTTLAKEISDAFGLGDEGIVHLDDFFLPVSRRAAGWEREHFGNLDLARFEREVLSHIGEDSFEYSPFDCRTQSLLEARRIRTAPLLVIEGSFCQKTDWLGHYGIKIFVTADRKTQLDRLNSRSRGAGIDAFLSLWMPREEAYFRDFSVEERAVLIYDTSAHEIK